MPLPLPRRSKHLQKRRQLLKKGRLVMKSRQKCWCVSLNWRIGWKSLPQDLSIPAIHPK
jgi:hypothetical protein